MAKDFIVAIELGSSKMTGIAGKKNPDGSITVLAVAKEDSTSCIRKGAVYSIDKTAQGLTNIVNKLKATLQTEITRVYVGVGGQSLRGIKNVIIKDLPAESIVSQDMINELMDANRNMVYPDYEILDAITQEYKVDSIYNIDPVGIPARRLEGNYLNVQWRKSFYRNLNKCFDMAGISIAEMYTSPLVLADNVLTEAEKRSGCVLVDLGAETTTVSVYYRDILRHLSVIPLGSNNITKDLESLQMDEKEAELMKLKYGSAYTDAADIDGSMMWAIDKNRSVESRLFLEVVEARMLEIIENVWCQVPNEYADKLVGGLILTGGGSNMRNIEKAFRHHTHIDKIRVAKFVALNISTESPKIVVPRDGTMNSLLSLLAKGDINCAGNDLNRTLFGNDDNDEPAANGTASGTTQASGGTTAKPTTTRSTDPLRHEPATAKTPQQAKPQTKEDEDEEEEEKPKRQSIFGKAVRFMKKFGSSIIEEEK